MTSANSYSARDAAAGLPSPPGAKAGGSGEAQSPLPFSPAEIVVADSASRLELDQPPANLLESFLAEEDANRALLLWLVRHPFVRRRDRPRIADVLAHDIASLDEALSKQVNAIIHHPRFQKLESSWRGLQILVNEASKAPQLDPYPGQEATRGLLIRVLNVSWREVSKDLTRAPAVEQSVLFQKIHDQEFDMPGGKPYGVLIGDYEIHHRPSREHPYDDLEILEQFSQISKWSFSPLITGLHASFFGLGDFTALERGLDLQRLINRQNPDYTRWHAFRKTDESRFVGLVLPHVLMRLPYKDTDAVCERYVCTSCGARFTSSPDAHRCADDSSAGGPTGRRHIQTERQAFRFHEDVEGPDSGNYLWGNAAYAFATVVMRAYLQFGWMADIRGFDRNEDTGGLVRGFPVHSFGLDAAGIAAKSMGEVIIDEHQEAQFGDQGFIPLCHAHDTEFSVFHGNHSVHAPAAVKDELANVNERIHSMLQYTLCASRFAHYLKIQLREKLGSMHEKAELENFLNDWIQQYVTVDDLADAETRARYPLRDAGIELRDIPGRPGQYQLVMRLRPHYQLDDMSVGIRMVAKVNAEIVQ